MNLYENYIEPFEDSDNVYFVCGRNEKDELIPIKIVDQIINVYRETGSLLDYLNSLSCDMDQNDKLKIKVNNDIDYNKIINEISSKVIESINQQNTVISPEGTISLKTNNVFFEGKLVQEYVNSTKNKRRRTL